MPACQHDAVEHNTTVQVERLKQRIEGTQQLAGLDRHGPTARKKRLGGNFRLIARVTVLDDDTIVQLLRVLPRGGHDYAAFCLDPEQFVEN